MKIQNRFGMLTMAVGLSWNVASAVAPIAPNNVHSIDETNSTITIGWTDNSNNEQHFKIYRVLKGSPGGGADTQNSSSSIHSVQPPHASLSPIRPPQGSFVPIRPPLPKLVDTYKYIATVRGNTTQYTVEELPHSNTPYKFAVAASNTNTSAKAHSPYIKTTHTWSGMIQTCFKDSFQHENKNATLNTIPSRIELESLERFRCDVIQNQLVDLSPMIDLKSLKSAYLPNNSIKDLSPLKALSGLVELNLNENKEKLDLSALLGMSSLEYLSICNDRVHPSDISIDLSHISKLTSLKKLYLSGHNISDLTPLSAMTSLSHLGLWNNNISDLAPLSPLTSLSELQLGGNNITNLTPLSHLHSLTLLYVGNNNFNNFRPLTTLNKLTILYMRNNNISDLADISAMGSLIELNLWDNDISDLTPLSSLPSLKELYLSGNNISDLTPLSTMTSLTELDLNNNNISDLTPLSTLTSLIKLELNDNNISDVLPLWTLAFMDRLSLQSNYIIDIRPLMYLGVLSSLHLSYNCIEDFSPVGSGGYSSWPGYVSGVNNQRTPEECRQ